MPSLPSWQPQDDMPMPSEEALASGTVGPMDVPITTPVPFLCINNRRYRKRRNLLLMRRSIYRRWQREGRKRQVPIKLMRLRKLKRRRSIHRLPVLPGLQEKAQQLQEMDEEFLVSKNLRHLCSCKACNHLKRWSSTILPYKCTNVNCRLVFDTFTELFEHQLDVHGGLDPRANRVVDDVFHQQQGTLAFPPSTVYIGQQYMYPSRAPRKWESMDELAEEAETLLERLWNYNRYYFALPYKLFVLAHIRVRRIGVVEMERQYQIAMEHFYSGYKFPASSRGFHDGCPSVERGRNWLTSTDREDARLLHPFSLGDKVDAEPEFVLIDTKRDQEMHEELNRAADGDEVIAVDSDDDEDEPARERKVFEQDSDDTDEVQAATDRKSSQPRERKVFEQDKNNDDEVEEEEEDEDDEEDEEKNDVSSSEDDNDSGEEHKGIKQEDIFNHLE